MSDAPLHLDLAEAPPDGRAFWLNPPGARIRAAVWPGEGRGTALIFSGRTEYIEKYGRVAGDLRARGFAVATLDWRGQGLSERPLTNPMKGHVGDFAEYQRDVEAFLAAPEVAALPGPRLLLCHSMGGCIGMRALMEGRAQPEAAVMSAPMLGLAMSGAQRALAHVLSVLAGPLGLGERFTPDPKPDVGYVLKTAFERNNLTTDREHYAWMRRHLEAAPDLALGPPTIGWLAAALREMRAIAKAPPLATPMLMLLGSREEIVSPSAIRAFAARCGNCELAEIAGAKHEILMETPEIRAEVWRRIDAFLDARF